MQTKRQKAFSRGAVYAQPVSSQTASWLNLVIIDIDGIVSKISFLHSVCLKWTDFEIWPAENHICDAWKKFLLLSCAGNRVVFLLYIRESVLIVSIRLLNCTFAWINLIINSGWTLWKNWTDSFVNVICRSYRFLIVCYFSNLRLTFSKLIFIGLICIPGTKT